MALWDPVRADEETKMILDNGHIAQDVLEEYALGHLNEAEEEVVEEHLLLCHECQDRLGDIDDFVRALRVASPAVEAGPSRAKTRIQERLWGLAGALPAWKPMYAAGALAAALAIIILAPGQRRPDGPAVEVSLEAIRGGSPGGAEAVAGRPLVLRIDLKGLEGVSTFAIEIADVGGAQIWRANVDGRGGGFLQVKPGVTLRTGDYWVRAYDEKAPGELLREFGLRVRAAE
jgi:hypothetical protein